MSYVDAEKKRAIEIAAKYDQFMPMVTKNGAESTANLRVFIGKVEKHAQRLAQIAREAHTRLGYIANVEQNVTMLEGLLKKAETLSDQLAAEVLNDKGWGHGLMDYAYNKSNPAKPQLVSTVKRGIEKEVNRAKKFVADLEQSQVAWDKSAHKHVSWCEKAKAAVAGAAFE
jgi:hypothetical protein